MREKYYPSRSFRESGLGGKPSYIWRSIWKAKLLLEQRLVWRVRDGRSIRVCHDKWLPGLSNAKVQTPVDTLGDDATVNLLID